MDLLLKHNGANGNNGSICSQGLEVVQWMLGLGMIKCFNLDHNSKNMGDILQHVSTNEI